MVIKLKAEKRNIKGKKVKNLLKQNLIPAIVYGPDQEPICIQIKKNDFYKAFEQGGTSTIILLNINNGEIERETLIHNVDFNPTKDTIIHADFYCLKKGHQVHTEVPLKFINEAKPVKEQNAVLIKHLSEIPIKCLPQDLINEIIVDLSKIQDIDDVIKVKDLDIPNTIQIDLDPEDIIVTVTIEKNTFDQEQNQEQQKTLEIDKNPEVEPDNNKENENV